MNRRTKKVTTHLIASYIAQEIDVPFAEVLEILELEHKYSQELIKNGETVSYSKFVIFKPCITKDDNRSCKAKLSQLFREYLKQK